MLFKKTQEEEVKIKVDSGDTPPSVETSVMPPTPPKIKIKIPPPAPRTKIPPPPPLLKTKIGERLDLAVKNAETTRNRSSDLVPLTQGYEKLKKQLKALVTSAKMYHEHSILIQKSRYEVSTVIAR
jgi:hypothetical protein